MIYYGASYSEMQSHKYLNIYHMWSAQKEDITKMHDKKQHQIVPWWFLVLLRLHATAKDVVQRLILNYLISFHPSSILIIVLKVQDEFKVPFCVYTKHSTLIVTKKFSLYTHAFTPLKLH